MNVLSKEESPCKNGMQAFSDQNLIQILKKNIRPNDFFVMGNMGCECHHGS